MASPLFKLFPPKLQFPLVIVWSFLKMHNIEETSRNSFCIRFLFEMTLVGREIWTNTSLSDTQKSEALKWVNEINHRVIGAYNNKEYALGDLHQIVLEHSMIVPILAKTVDQAWKRAIEKTK